MINIKNQQNIKNKNGIGNYILNAYKIRKKDNFLELIRSDTSKLRFNNFLKIHSKIY